jgi:hypothetical protein
MATEKQQKGGQKGCPTTRKRAGADEKGENTRVHIKTLPPRTVITEGADPSLVTQGWVGDKPRCDHRHRDVRDCRHAPHRCLMARKVAEPKLHAADGVWGSHHHLQESFPDTDSGAEPSEKLGIRRQYHKRFHLRAGHPAHILRICGSMAPNAPSCRGRCIAIEP